MAAAGEPRSKVSAYRGIYFNNSEYIKVYRRSPGHRRSFRCARADAGAAETRAGYKSVNHSGDSVSAE